MCMWLMFSMAVSVRYDYESYQIGQVFFLCPFVIQVTVLEAVTSMLAICREINVKLNVGRVCINIM